MPTYLVRLYSPFTVKTFALRVEAPTVAEAKKQLIGKTIIDPTSSLEFDVEEHHIISVVPVVVYPLPPYPLMSEDEVKKAEWLKGAIIDETRPIPKGGTPVGSPRLASVLPDTFTSLFFEQEVRSKCIRFLEPYTMKILGKEYHYNPGDIECGLTWAQARELCAIKFKVLKSPPFTPLMDPKGRTLKEGEEVTYSDPEDLEWAKLQVARGNMQQLTSPIAEWAYPEARTKVRYKIDIFSKFYYEAKRKARADKIKEAILYLVQYAPGLTVREIAEILEIGYWTAYRIIKSLAHPAAAKQIEAEAEEYSTLEEWLPAQLAEIKKQPPTFTPQILIGPKRRGQLTIYPVKHLKEEEVWQELKRILTLEGYPAMTPEEEESLRKQLHEYWQRKQRERLTYYLR